MSCRRPSCARDRFHCPDQRFGFRGNEGRASVARPRARNSLAVSACGGGFAGFTLAPAGTALAFFALNLASSLVAMSFALSSTSSPLGDPSRLIRCWSRRTLSQYDGDPFHTASTPSVKATPHPIASAITLCEPIASGRTSARAIGKASGQRSRSDFTRSPDSTAPRFRSITFSDAMVDPSPLRLRNTKPNPKITRPELADADISWHFVPNPTVVTRLFGSRPGRPSLVHHLSSCPDVFRGRERRPG